MAPATLRVYPLESHIAEKLHAYARLAARDRLPWPDLDAVTDAVRELLDPLLAGCTGDWDPASWRWSSGE